jgi:hypothetical protein
MDRMARSEKQAAQTRAAARARTRALIALSHLHADEYRSLYEREALAEGVLPNSLRAQMIADAA